MSTQMGEKTSITDLEATAVYKIALQKVSVEILALEKLNKKELVQVPAVLGKTNPACFCLGGKGDRKKKKHLFKKIHLLYL